jgi:hypothetical protein
MNDILRQFMIASRDINFTAFYFVSTVLLFNGGGCISAKDDPACGSVNAIVPVNSPVSIRGINCSFSDAEPKWQITLAAAEVKNG